MPQHISTIALLVLFLQPVPSNALDSKEPDPLFASDELIEVTIEAPLSTIMRDRSVNEYSAAKLRYSDPEGNIVEFDIGVRARGQYRRREDICNFAPLRLNFKKSLTKNTIFHHQDKLKVVTHCQSNSPRYDQYVLSEYLAYRILNLVANVSYRVRLVRVTYIDTADRDRTTERLAMIIEHRDRLAKRINAATVDAKTVKFTQLRPADTNINSVFHYFIGNTDFSQIVARPGDDCCHNHSIFSAEGKHYFSVPYDFDMSGFVNAPHAVPDGRLKLRNVRQRHYRGRCFNNSYISASVEKFFEQRDNIYSLISAQELMTKATHRATLKFVDDFFKSLSSPKKIEKKLVRDCI